ncbi:MAG TPA: hypothetical protein VHS28_03910 [Chloroflexota bacterium]|nr:hypothetical protein [Chloroflexota bacterium]
MDPRIAKLLTDAEKSWGHGALVRLGDAVDPEKIDCIPTGFPALDVALGVGGLPCGRISEISGPDSCGKQALAASLIAQCQGQEGVAVYLDPGRRLDPEQMRAYGVDPRALLVAQPEDDLLALELAIRLARGGDVRLVVFDSGSRVRSGGLSLALRRLVAAVDGKQIAFVFIGSFRSDSFGAQALRFFASVRLTMERREWIRRGRDVMGCRSLVTVAKNKLAAPLKEVELDLLFFRFPPAAPVLQMWRSDGEEAASSTDLPKTLKRAALGN